MPFFHSHKNSQPTSKGKEVFHKKPLGRRWHLANRPLWSVRLVPLRLERSESAVSLEYFLADANLQPKCPPILYFIPPPFLPQPFSISSLLYHFACSSHIFAKTPSIFCNSSKVPVSTNFPSSNTRILSTFFATPNL